MDRTAAPPRAAARAEAVAEPTRRRGRALAQNLALSFGSLFLFLLVLEGILRALGYGQVELYRPDPRLYWTLAPDQHRFTKVNHQPVITSSRGTRGPEFAVPKPPNTLRILSLGDSKTFGWGLSDEQTYSRRLEAALRRLAPGRRVEVINAGVDAWSYDQMRVFLREVALKWQPDVVLLADANLWTQFSEHASPAFVQAFERRVHLKNLLRRSALYDYVIELKLSWVYARLRTRFIPVDPTNPLQGNSPPSALRAHLAEEIGGIAELVRQHGLEGVILYIPMVGELKGGPALADGMVREVKREAAQAYGLTFLDLTAALRRAGPDGLYLEGDPVHPNARGDSAIAAAIVPVLDTLPALAPGRRVPPAPPRPPAAGSGA